MELRLADVFDEPIIEIRGKVSIEIGNRTLADGSTRFRLSINASGTIKVIKLGNLASGAAKFVLEKGDALEDLEFWGVAAFQTNFAFLERTASSCRARRCCRSTPPGASRPRRSRSRASRAASCSRCRSRARRRCRPASSCRARSTRAGSRR